MNRDAAGPTGTKHPHRPPGVDKQGAQTETNKWPGRHGAVLRVTCCGTRPPERRKATVATTPTGRPHTGPPMCAGIRGSHRACEGLPPGVVKSVKTKNKGQGGWETKVNYPDTVPG